MFTLIGNVIWFVTGGFILGTLYFISALIFFPLLPFLFPLIRYAYFPFGKRPVSKKAINAFKEENNMPIDEDILAKSSSVVRFIANVVWVIFPGVLLALLHFISACINLILCILIITVPVCLPSALGNFKMIKVALVPFGVKIVPNSLADDIEYSGAKKAL